MHVSLQTDAHSVQPCCPDLHDLAAAMMIKNLHDLAAAMMIKNSHKCTLVAI